MLHEGGAAADIAAASKSEDILRAVFNATDALICVSTIFGEFVEVNQAFCEACGTPREELVGRPSAAAGLWVDLARREEYLELLGKSGAVDCFAARMRHAGGRIHDCLLTGRVIRAGGAPLVVTIARDVSGTCT